MFSKPSLALRGYTLFVAAWTFFLVLAGGAVATLGLEDLPLVHSHQGMGATAGVFTVVLALWLWRSPVEPALKRAGGTAVLLVLLQGLLGGISVFLEWPTTTAVAHACLGQLFFAWMACTAWMVNTPDHVPMSLISPEAQKMYRISATTTGFVLLQLLAGAIYRHTGQAFHFHLLGAFLVFLHGVLVLKRALRSPSLSPLLKIGALGFNGLIALQVALGFLSWKMPQPFITTAHQSLGAILLATILIITVQSTRQKTHP